MVVGQVAPRGRDRVRVAIPAWPLGWDVALRSDTSARLPQKWFGVAVMTLHTRLTPCALCPSHPATIPRPPRSELFVTEASHLRTLRVLDLIFYQRMKKENLMPREELARLFPNLPELIEIHSEGPSSPPAVFPPHPVPGQPSGVCPHLTVCQGLPEQTALTSSLWRTA